MYVMRLAAVLLFVALLLPAHAARAGDALAGKARIVDGDTLAIGDAHVRLYGIDAPEAGQTCKRDNGKAWSCGRAAIKALAELAEGKDVRCEHKGRDTEGRLRAACLAGGADLGAQMVLKGMAWAFVKEANDYAAVENSARLIGAGMWQGTAEPPWEYRDERWKSAAGQAPKGCPIKGVLSEGRRTYHTPWSPAYDAAEIRPAKGERWFCSVREAEEAGWRAPTWR